MRMITLISFLFLIGGCVPLALGPALMITSAGLGAAGTEFSKYGPARP
jgi:hypothetical protein